MTHWIVKRMGDTRRQREAKVARTFGPLYHLVADLRADAVDSIRGEPVIVAWGHYMSAANTLTGFAGCFARIDKSADLTICARLANKLHYSTPITEAEVDALESSLRQLEAIYRRTPMSALVEAIRTEQIAIELDEMGATTA